MLYFQNRQVQGGRSPVTRILIALLLVLAGVVALIFGAVILVVLLGTAAIFFALWYLRGWWLRRKLGLNVRPRHVHKRHAAGVTIEGEYTVEDAKDKR